MNKKLFYSSISAVFFSCQTLSSDISQNLEKEILSDGCFGYVVHEGNVNNCFISISIGLTSKQYENCANTLSVMVTSDKFPTRTTKEQISLTFLIEHKNGNKESLGLKLITISTKDLKQHLEYIKSNKIDDNNREFYLSKTDYIKLMEAKNIRYILKTPSNIENREFNEKELSELKSYSKRLLAPICVKFDSIEESDRKLKKGFIDFEILKAGALKSDLEKHFNTRFNNKEKDPDTGAYEEIIIVKIFKKDYGPMTIAFDENDRLVYIRDILNREKIIYPKPRKES